MLAFRVKQPSQNVLFDKSLAGKIDPNRWGVEGRETIQALQGMRDRIKGNLCEKAADQLMAAELPATLFKYLGLLKKATVICRGISLTEAELGFKWRDAVDQECYGHEDDWTFERCSILFTLAACYSINATCQDRSTAKGVFDAKELFQRAAGVLERLYGEREAASWKGSDDLQLSTIKALKTLMTAQAMKCMFEAARDGGKPDALLAKLATICHQLYEDLQAQVTQAKGRPGADGKFIGIARMSDRWLVTIDWNRHLFDALQNYYLAKGEDAACKYGVALSRYTHATNQAARVVNMVRASGADERLQEQFVKAHQLCSTRQSELQKDNTNIYYETVPEYASLPKPPLAMALVKPTVPPELDDPAIANPPDPEPLPAPPPAAREPSLPVEAPTAPPIAPMADMRVKDEGAAPASNGEAAGAAKPDDVQQLEAMGFEAAKARAALEKANGSLEAATELLLAG